MYVQVNEFNSHNKFQQWTLEEVKRMENEMEIHNTLNG